MTHREVKKAGCRRACKINAPRRTGRYMSKTVPEAHPDTGDSDCLQGGRKLSRNKLLPLKKKNRFPNTHTLYSKTKWWYILWNTGNRKSDRPSGSTSPVSQSPHHTRAARKHARAAAIATSAAWLYSGQKALGTKVNEETRGHLRAFAERPGDNVKLGKQSWLDCQGNSRCRGIRVQMGPSLLWTWFPTATSVQVTDALL